MFGGGNGKGGDLGPVVIAPGAKGFQGVAALKVNQVRQSTQARALAAGHAPAAEIVQLEREFSVWVIAGLLQGGFQNLLEVIALGADRRCVPYAHQTRLKPAGQPGHFGIGVGDGHQGVMHRDEHPLRHSANLQREFAAVFAHNVHPAVIWKRLAVRGE